MYLKPKAKKGKQKLMPCALTKRDKSQNLPRVTGQNAHPSSSGSERRSPRAQCGGKAGRDLNALQHPHRNPINVFNAPKRGEFRLEKQVGGEYEVDEKYVSEPGGG